MAKTLVLAEKPSVGKELARVLGCRRGGEGCLEGERYIVTWALATWWSWPLRRPTTRPGRNGTC